MTDTTENITFLRSLGADSKNKGFLSFAVYPVGTQILRLITFNITEHYFLNISDSVQILS